MNKDKPQVSFKINGQKINTQNDSGDEKELPAPVKEEYTIADWKERQAVEKEQAATYWGVFSPKKKRMSLIEKIRQERQRSLPLYFFSLVGGAVFIGLLFGMTMLHLFSGDKPSMGAVVEETETELPILAQYSDSLVMHVIQAGAYKEKETGMEMQENLQRKDYPTVLTHDGDYYYLFTGISFDEQGAERLASFYEEEGLNVYQKTRSIPEPKHKQGQEAEREKLLASKSLIITIAGAVAEEGAEKEQPWLKELDAHLQDTKSWKKQEDTAFAELWGVLEIIRKEGSEANKSASVMQEWLMEAALYYEEAVYVFNEEENTATDKEENAS
ncbi:hypothetical protein [Bacillus piscicola]|uniref:hypothetical protein n=1 Tax=Bacillus piscicola TaxID=1632684 RepID=UPI001F08A21C|nr:hypothetical protein [Bacillus piscicola]